MEIFDLYDRFGNLLPNKMERGGTNKEGEYHLVVHIWIKNSSGAFLIQQRNKKSDRVPFQWACTGGAAVSGDSSLEAAWRETYEEIGLDVPKHKFELVKRYFVEDPISNYITDLYVVKEDILINELKLDTVEVRDVKYATMAEIKQMINDNLFWDYERFLSRKGYFSLLEKS